MKPSHLRLIQFNSSDYSLGGTLSRDHGEILRNPEEISATLSLYFQWPEYRMASVNLPSPKSPNVKCELDYDRDERVPTEIILTVNDSAVLDPNLALAAVQVRLEIFRTCYTFDARVLAVDQERKDQRVRLILMPPETLLVTKYRRSRRYVVDDSAGGLLISGTWRARLPEDEHVGFQITEVGLNSICVSPAMPIPSGPGTVEIGGARFSGDVLPDRNGKTVIALKFGSETEFGKYFDLYREVAFPALVPKMAFDQKKIVELYKNSGFFSKFFAGKHEDDIAVYLREIERVWSAVATGQHSTTAEYVTTDAQGDPIGACSATLGFFNFDNVPVWILQQLCTLTLPEYFDETRQLYSWRAEYLYGRPGRHLVACWFDSTSRWLERIWVKFATEKNTKRALTPVQLRILPAVPEAGQQSHDCEIYTIGDTSRAILREPQLLAGAGPRFLNAGGILDNIVALDAEPRLDQLKSVASNLTRALGLPSCEIRLTLPASWTHPELDSMGHHVSDRFCIFEKDELMDYLASIEHSLAITERRLRNG